MKFKPSIALGALACMMATAPLSAQLPETNADRADSREGRIDRALRAPGGAAAFALAAGEDAGFMLTLAAPVTWNSNVLLADGGPHKASVHITPSARLEWHSGGAFQVFARAQADHDFYTEGSSYDASTLGGRVGVRLTDDSIGGFRPYAHYSPVMIFEGGFANRQVTLHNFTAGLGRSFDMGGGTTLAVDLSGTRREASRRASEQNRVTGLVSLSGAIGQSFGWALEQSVQQRWYTGGANDGRDDLNLISTLAFSYQPSPRGSLDFGVSFERNASDRLARDFSVWDVGPSVSFTWKL